MGHLYFTIIKLRQKCSTKDKSLDTSCCFLFSQLLFGYALPKSTGLWRIIFWISGTVHVTIWICLPYPESKCCKIITSLVKLWSESGIFGHEIWFLKMNTLCGAPSISSLLASLSFHVLSSPSKLLWQQSFAEAQCLLPAGRHTAGSLWSVFVKKMSRYLQL